MDAIIEDYLKKHGGEAICFACGGKDDERMLIHRDSLGEFLICSDCYWKSLSWVRNQNREIQIVMGVKHSARIPDRSNQIVQELRILGLEVEVHERKIEFYDTKRGIFGGICSDPDCQCDGWWINSQ